MKVKLKGESETNRSDRAAGFEGFSSADKEIIIPQLQYNFVVILTILLKMHHVICSPYVQR